MSQRTCSIDGCERAHLARGMCSSHYGNWHRKVNGRKPSEFHDVTCIVCGRAWISRRREARLCSDECRGKHYAATMTTRCKLPNDHPVRLEMQRQREAKRKPKGSAYEWRTARECPGCACWFTPLYTPTAVTCSKRCARRVERRKRRAREHGAAGTWTWSEFMRVARKFDYCCAYCGTKPSRLDPDHVVPLSRGGYDSPANLLPACAECNSSKCAMSLQEWNDWREARGLPKRRTTWAPSDPRYTHLTQARLAAA